MFIHLLSAVNLARGRATKMSSIYRQFKSSRAVDGNNDTYIHTATYQRTAWWWVRLDATSVIEKIHILYRNNCKLFIRCLPCTLSFVLILYFTLLSHLFPFLLEACVTCL